MSPDTREFKILMWVQRGKKQIQRPRSGGGLQRAVFFYRCFEIGKKNASMAGPCESLSIFIIFEGSNTEVKCVVSDLSVEIRVKNNPPGCISISDCRVSDQNFCKNQLFYTVK